MYFYYECLLQRVVDGDTLVVDIDLGLGMWLRNQYVRLSGIDTPESRTSDPVEDFYGEAAKERVKQLLGDLEKPLMRIDRRNEKDKYGRILGDIVLRNGAMLSDTLLAEHHAVPYSGQNKTEVKAAHLENREWLKQHGVGLMGSLG